jgi:hypothetical protein
VVTQESNRNGTGQPSSLSDHLLHLQPLDPAPRLLSCTPRLPFIRQDQLTNHYADHYAGHTVRHCKLRNVNWILCRRNAQRSARIGEVAGWTGFRAKVSGRQ